MLRQIVTLMLLIAAFGVVFYFRAPIKDAFTSFFLQANDFRTMAFDELLSIGSRDVIAPSPLRAREEYEARESLLTRSGVLEETNAHRRENGAAPLKENALLSAAATAKARDMLERQYFEHESPGGMGPAEIIEDSGYAFIVVGENLALGRFKDDATLLQAWMDSPGHRANILEDRYTEIGISVLWGTFEGIHTWIAVQEFGKPRADCPSVDGALKARIETNQTRLNAMQRQLDEHKLTLGKKPRTSDEVRSYNAVVREYNELVREYNGLAEETKQDIERYNTEVRNINSCLRE